MTHTPPFKEAEASDSTGFLLWQVTSLWQRKIAAVLRPHQLTQVQFALLASLLWLSQQEELITQTLLARHAKLDIMMTSQVLRKLETRGLIQRLPHPSDTRANMLRLTEAGPILTHQAVPDVEQADEAFFNHLQSKQLQFNECLRTLNKP